MKQPDFVKNIKKKYKNVSFSITKNYCNKYKGVEKNLKTYGRDFEMESLSKEDIRAKIDGFAEKVIEVLLTEIEEGSSVVLDQYKFKIMYFRPLVNIDEDTKRIYVFFDLCCFKYLNN